MRLIEIRLLDGPSVYRLEPVAKVEVAIGRRRSWYGPRDPAPYNLVRLGAAVAPGLWPPEVETLRHWIARFRQAAGEGRTVGLDVHRSSDPGHWIVTWPWVKADRARVIADAALDLTNRGIRHASRADLGPRQRRRLDRWIERVRSVEGDPPAWIRDADRRIPIVSISGTNGKSTTTRLITRILRGAGRHVGTTTSDGVLVDETMVEPGDWTGPGGAKAILERDDVEVAVLETARGGIVLRGLGYESNEASILTNVTSDHLDLQGIHTLPELAEVKGTICRITKPDGWVILNADDRWVAAIAREVKARIAYFTMEGERSALVRRHLRRGGRAYLVRDGVTGEADGPTWHALVAVADIPIAFGGVARHNIANALAAAAGARALGATLEDVRRGLLDFRPSSDASPGRLNVFRAEDRVVIVDFAHNEAGIAALLDVAQAIAGGRPVTAIIGTAGDRPDDTLRGLARIAAERVQRLVIKESLDYLRGRSRESVIGELRAGATGAGWRAQIPIYESETDALRGELERPDAPNDEVIVLLCHEDRAGVFALLSEQGFGPVDATSDLARLMASH
ncbi:MAG TPA: Mur ligase family protein [Candidatus Limnocylindrales bacterium]|nr:Mur ligase family protein [Candidatus Limnocylindrales bacterium]